MFAYDIKLYKIIILVGISIPCDIVIY